CFWHRGPLKRKESGLAGFCSCSWFSQKPIANSQILNTKYQPSRFPSANQLRNRTPSLVQVRPIDSPLQIKLGPSRFNCLAGGPGFQPLVLSSRIIGCPSIRAKALSRTKNPWRCASIAIPARDVDDENSGKHLLHLYLNHQLVERF